MDFVVYVCQKELVNFILVLISWFTYVKYAHFIGLRHPYNDVSMAEVFLKEVVRLHRFPASNVSDRDRIF